MNRHVLLVVTLFSALGCASTWSEVPSVPTPPPTGALGEQQLPPRLLWVRNSAEHRALLLQTFRAAGWVLEATVYDREPGTWAVALDCDETVLDNSLYEKERALVGEAYSEETWDRWVRRRVAVPLPGALEFLRHIDDLGGKIAIVTNRLEEHCEATAENLRDRDMPFDLILCRRETEEKEARWKRIENGTAAEGLPPLEIVMWLGDNIQDFPDLDQSVRFEGDGAFAPFGSRFFMLPNPLYGSWTENPPE